MSAASLRLRAQKGFTLVEILIVVIILGILAAIVIPQFTSASQDARENSLVSQVQTIRSQVELYKLQHTTDGSELFQGATATDQWAELLGQTNKDGTAGTECGPYLQTLPVNGVTNRSTVAVDNTVTEATTTVVDATAGFVYNPDTGKFFALQADGTLWE